MLRISLLIALATTLSAVDGVVTTNAKALSSDESLASATSKGALILSVGDVTFVAGYRQFGDPRQDPIIMRFDGQGDHAVKTWQRTDIDTSPADSRAVGLLWDGDDRFYVLITVDGGSNDAGTVRRFTGNGWLHDYGPGGGPHVTVALRVDPSNGEPITGTYIRAQLSNGNANSATPTAVALHGDAVVVHLSSFFSPLRVNRQRMEHNGGSSPFPWRVVLEPSMNQARRSEAVNFDGVENIPLLPQRQVRLSVGGSADTVSAQVIVNDTVVARPEGDLLDSGIYDPAAPCRFVFLPPTPDSSQ